MTVKTYDPKSYELAMHFLQDEKFITEDHTKFRRRELAKQIQQAVEDWLEENPLKAA